MILELTISIFLGITAGTITGLIPGVHTNLVSVILISSSLFLLNYFTPIGLVIFIIAMSIANSFVDFIPSIYLGAPDEETVLGVMPGHKFLLSGKGHEAIVLTLIGSGLGIFLFIIFIPVFSLVLPVIYPFLQKIMGFILIWISILLILGEKTSKLRTIIIFILAGFLGISVFNLNINQPLLPLLSGLFGSSTLIYSISKQTQIPEQKTNIPKIEKRQLIKPVIATSIISPICSFLPGLSSSEAAIIGSKITGKLNKKQFLILLGSINTLIMSLSFITLYLINKSRTGSASAISQIIELSKSEMILIILTIILSAIISVIITIKISKLVSNKINKINYTKISKIILILIALIILVISGLTGMLVFIISTVLGLTCISFNVRRGFLMGSLLVPTILYYLPFF